MVKTTMVARVSDGLPLAASMDDEQVWVNLQSLHSNGLNWFADDAHDRLELFKRKLKLHDVQ